MSKKMISYKLRAECQYDVGRMLRVVPVVTLTIEQAHADLFFADVVVTFTTWWSLNLITDVLREIEDGHVMLETIALEAEYTGYRVEPLDVALRGEFPGLVDGKTDVNGADLVDWLSYRLRGGK